MTRRGTHRLTVILPATMASPRSARFQLFFADVTLLLLLLQVSPQQSDGCDVAAAQECVSGLSTTLDAATKTRTQLTSECKAIETGLTCMDSKMAGCSDSSLDSTRDTFSSLHSNTCNEGSYCYSDFATCQRQEFPGVESADLSSNCNDDVLPMAQCVDGLKKSCRVMQQVATVYSLIKNLQFKCYLDTCPELGACKQALEDTGITTGTVNINTCNAFSTYATCLSSAVPKCAGLTLSSNLPTTDDVALRVTTGCGVLVAEVSIAICNGFLTCVTSKLATVPWYSPEVMCVMVQMIAGCAASWADSVTCQGITNPASFIQRLNGYMIDTANQHCGVPDVNMDSCPAFTTCKSLLSSVASDADFSTVCTAVQTFLRCADESLNTCSIPVTTKPRLSQLADLTVDLCPAVDGQAIENCLVFKTCARLAVSDLPISSDGTLLSSAYWCSTILRTLQCVQSFGESCSVSTELKETLTKLYDEFINKGDCKNEYDFTTGGCDRGLSPWNPVVLLLLFLLSIM